MNSIYSAYLHTVYPLDSGGYYKRAIDITADSVQFVELEHDGCLRYKAKLNIDIAGAKAWHVCFYNPQGKQEEYIAAAAQ
ncbi:hypothetical protein [Escherichia coli]|uniref:hypothetical protein n=1 Tax=Escherichia coli TaxID=562 RepID=UPI000391211A|nr:hypothetical protein [Escherichia coli]EQQ73929.1 hypothetical protein G772_02524 [Escherichia coli HVH 111 (4-7039018)]